MGVCGVWVCVVCGCVCVGVCVGVGETLVDHDVLSVHIYSVRPEQEMVGSSINWLTKFVDSLYRFCVWVYI